MFDIETGNGGGGREIMKLTEGFIWKLLEVSSGFLELLSSLAT